MKTYRPREFAELISKSTSTLRRWDREGILPAKRGAGGQRFYSDEDLLIALNIERVQQEKKVIAYYRVSTNAQKLDLESQRKSLEIFCTASGIAVTDWLSDIGSGLNFKRKNFLKIMQMVQSGTVENLIIAHKDRLCRFGFDYFAEFCSWNNCRITVINNESLSPQKEMIDDMLAVVHCFSSRLYGLRRYKTELKKIVTATEE
jgi:predicted site-specific integrase-resolvase